MRSLLLLPLLAVSCTLLAGSTIDEGDRLFRTGQFQPALREYQSAWDSGAHGDELARKIRETRYRVVAEYARDLLNREEPLQAFEVLKEAEKLRPGHPLTAELRARVGASLAQEYMAAGKKLLEEEQPVEALDAYTRAVSWQPENEQAQAGLALAQEAAEARYAKGERLFLLGLEEVGDGHDRRAYTAFTKAEDLWGAGSRATNRLHEVAGVLAADSRIQGEAYLQAGEVGAAWIALRDANRLTPGDPTLEALVKEAEDRMAAEAAMANADHGIRAGDLEFAEDQIAEASMLGGRYVAQRLGGLQDSLKTRRNHDRYVMARALELDNQMVRAGELYQAILNEPVGDVRDVRARLRTALRKIAEAKAANEAGTRALGSGDRDGARMHFQTAVDAARDYRDAADQLGKLEP